MKTVKVEILEKAAYLIPIGDLHIGDKGFNKESIELLEGYIVWVKERPNARIFLMGDILNCASRKSKTSPFEQDMTLEQQTDYAVEIFTPVQEQIIGAIDGNHETRLLDDYGYSPTSIICHRLGVPYLGYSAILDFKVGARRADKSRKAKNNTQYTIFAHHTTGGGGSIGSKMNRVDHLRKIVSNADVYLAGHNHMLGVVPHGCFMYEPQISKVIEKRQVLVDCGGYLQWDSSYAEAKQLESLKKGSPRIRLDGGKKDVHCEV